MTTGFALALLPGVRTDADYCWLEDTWQRHLGEEIRLAYKGALFLVALRDNPCRCSALVAATIDYLSGEQNDDGGYGPWRGHPVGSDPWSTGVVLAGLCALPETVDCSVIERAANWLVESQLSSGYWACHFIDEGTAYAYWGLSEAAKFLGAS